MKNQTTTITAIAIALLAIISFTSCESGINGVGENQVITPAVDDFNAVAISVSSDVRINDEADNALEISAQSNILDNMDIYVKNGVLMIEFDKEVNDHNPITININTTALTAVSFSGAGDVSVESSYSNSAMAVNVSGDCEVNFLDTLWCDNFNYNVSGECILNAKALVISNTFEADISGHDQITIPYLMCQTFDYNVSGEGYTTITGACDVQYLKASGFIKHQGLDFITNRTEVNIDGTGGLEVHVNDLLKTKVSGAAHIKYRGDATLDQNNSGVVTFEKVD